MVWARIERACAALPAICAPLKEMVHALGRTRKVLVHGGKARPIHPPKGAPGEYVHAIYA